MAVVTITGLTAVTIGNLTGAAVVEVEDSNVASRKATLAQVRTRMFAGGTGFTAADPLVVGTVTASGVITGNAGVTVASGQTLTLSGATIVGLTAASIGAATFPGGAYGFTGATTLTGGAGNMTIVAGTGNSRTLILQGTSSGGVATTNVTLSDTTAVFNSIALSGISTISTSSTINSQTISATANFTGTLTTAGLLTVAYSGATVVFKDTAAYSAGSSGPNIALQGLDSGSSNTTFGNIIGRPANGSADRGYVEIRSRLDGVGTVTATFGTGTSLTTTLAGALVITGGLSGATTLAGSGAISGFTSATLSSFMQAASARTGTGTANISLIYSPLFTATRPGAFLVYAYNTAGNMYATYLMTSDGTTQTATILNGSTGESMQWNGADIEMSQNSGSDPTTFTYHYLRIA